MVAAQAGLGLAKGLSSWFGRPKIPKAHETALGREYLSRNVEGLYDPEAERRILNVAGRSSGAAAQKATAGIRGGLVRRGMEGSIAGMRLQAEPGLARIGYMSEVGERMAATDEQVKREAGLQYAGYKDRQDEKRRQARQQALQGLIGGVTEGVQAGVGTYMEEKTLEGMEDFNKKYSIAASILDSGDDAAFERFMQENFPEYWQQAAPSGGNPRRAGGLKLPVSRAYGAGPGGGW